MHNQEFQNCMNRLGNYYSLGLTEDWFARWWKEFRGFESQDFMKAIDIWTAKSSRKPEIFQMKDAVLEAKRERVSREVADGVLSEKDIESMPSVMLFRKTSVIEFCMDVLGVQTVTEELKQIVNVKDTNAVKWSDLVERKDWLSAYKAKLSEMFESAKNFDPVQYHKRFKKA